MPLEIDQSFATLCTQKRLDGNMYPTLLQQIQVVADEIPGLAVHYPNTDIDIDTGDLRVTVNGEQPLLQVNVLNQGFIIALLCELEELNNFGNRNSIIFNAEINTSFPELTRFVVDNEFINNHRIVTTVLRFVIDKHINADDKLDKKEPTHRPARFFNFEVTDFDGKILTFKRRRIHDIEKELGCRIRNVAKLRSNAAKRGFAEGFTKDDRKITLTFVS